MCSSACRDRWTLLFVHFQHLLFGFDELLHDIGDALRNSDAEISGQLYHRSGSIGFSTESAFERNIHRNGCAGVGKLDETYFFVSPDPRDYLVNSLIYSNSSRICKDKNCLVVVNCVDSSNALHGEVWAFDVDSFPHLHALLSINHLVYLCLKKSFQCLCKWSRHHLKAKCIVKRYYNTDKLKNQLYQWI